jgi:putative oxidoreductase
MTTNAALLALRIALGVVFLAHGWRHVRGRAKVVAWTESIGYRSPKLQWAFMSLGELGIGAGFVAGLLTPAAAAGAVAIAAVAYWTVHRAAGFWVTARPDEGWEYVFVLAVAAVVVAALGPGEWSLDHRLGWSETLSGGTGAAIAASGLMAAILQLTLFFRRPR